MIDLLIVLFFLAGCEVVSRIVDKVARESRHSARADQPDAVRPRAVRLRNERIASGWSPKNETMTERAARLVAAGGSVKWR